MKNSTVTISDSAVKQITAITNVKIGKNALRISVEGGGCSGFSYKFNLVEGPQGEDIIVTKGTATVLIDKLSFHYVVGSQIDFVDNLMGQYFKINNPNAVANCGCGTSFAI